MPGVSSTSTRTALVGTGAVTVVALVLGVDLFVLEPLAAVPGMTPEQIHARLAVTDWATGRALGLALLAVGVAVAVAGAVLTVRRRWPALNVAAGYLALLALSTPAAFVAGFSTGMTVADTFGVSGGSHTPTGAAMRGVATVCAVAAVVVAVFAARRASGARDGARHVPAENLRGGV